MHKVIEKINFQRISEYHRGSQVCRHKIAIGFILVSSRYESKASDAENYGH